MKKYMYIDVCEREIYGPEFFDAKEEAIYHMVNDFLVVKDITSDIIPDVVDETTLEEALSILNEKEYFDDENSIDIESLSAYGTTMNHDNWDAKIFEVEI